MNAVDLVADLIRLGVKLWIENDQLRFKAPHGVVTPKLKTRLIEHKVELLAFLRQVQSSIKSSEAPPILPVPRDGYLPLSYAQERLWMADQWQRGDVSYNLSHGILIEGRIDLAALEQSLNEIIRRHEVLRTTIEARDGQPYQNIATNWSLSMRTLNLEKLSRLDREAEARRLIGVETSRTFDLARGPLLRVSIFRLEAERHILFFTVHHIVFDAWTTDVLTKEMAVLYEAFTSGRPSPLAELSIQYADFAQWQRQWMNGDRLEKQLTFWKEQLDGAPASLDLPTDRPRPPVKTTRGATYDFTLSPALSAEVRRFSRSERVTPFMVVLAALNTLLWKYSGQEDIVVGSPHANRNRSEIEDLIGFFVNSLVLRTKLSGEPAFLELIRRVHEVTVSAQEHQDLPFEKLVEDLQPERDLSRTPLFQVVLNFQKDRTTEMAVRGVVLKSLRLLGETSKFDLELTITDREPSLEAEIEYSTDLFESVTIARMARQFQVLLANALAHPDQRISEPLILAESERHQLVSEWNAAPVERSQTANHRCVHDLFEEQVERTPDAVALVSEDEQLTYRELDRRANRLAHHLRALGVGPESLVAICMERSVEIIIGMLGILKAGGAYLPMDPKYPVERLAFMLEDAQVAVLLTRRHLLSVLPEWGGETICLDTDWEWIEQNGEESPRSGVAPDNLAYVIYTSGSSGNPKGVMIHHESLVSYAATAVARYETCPSDRVLQFCSISFDISGEEIYPCLLRGGTLVLRTEAMLDSIAVFLETSRRWKLTFMSLPTAYWHEIAANLDESKLPPSLRMVIIAGESALPERLAVWREHAMGRVRLINTYGPTEATISVTMCELTGPPDKDAAPEVSIGRVIRDAEVYLLDPYLHPAPIGVPGEVCIGGLLVGRGYFDRPEMTAEKFIPSPFHGQTQTRLYRTGDLARYLPDGNLRFVGRVDQQVKIRGFRIELGEIETLLIRHPAINQAVVTVREDGAGSKQLVAYVVPNREQIPTSSELRDFVNESLPEYMAPSFFVMLEELPLTPNGKVDRRMLPEPDKVQAAAKAMYVAPRTLVEEILAGIWADVLNVERVGVNDSFFTLGGHSLLAAQLILQVQGALNVELSMLSVFKTPTLAGLAATIEDALDLGAAAHLPPIEPVSRGTDLPLSYAQQRLWFLDRLEPDNPFYNISGVLRLKGNLDIAALEKSMSEIVRRHESLRTIFTATDGEPRQRVIPAWTVKVEPVDLSMLSSEEQQTEASRWMIEDAQGPFDLVRGPLFRVQLLRLHDTEHIMLLTLHHIISDGWSIRLLVTEFTELYKGFKTDRPAQLPELSVQYPDYAMWQRQWLEGEVFETQMSYWKKQLGGTLSVLNLPLDRPRPAVLTYEGQEYEFRLPQQLAESLMQLSRQEGATLFMLMLAGFKALLYRYTGEEDLLVGTPIANRKRQEVEHVIGLLVNTLVLRTKVSVETTLQDLLRQVRDAALGAYANQDAPFEKLVEELQPERDSGRSPVFQVMFLLDHGGTADAIQLPELEVSIMEAESGTAKFEITLMVEERGGELTGAIEYNTDLFDAATIVRMAGHYGRLLEGMVADPERRISEIELLTEAERRQLVVDFNNTAVEYPFNESIQSLFERQADRNPESIAVVYEGDGLTYRELNRRANGLAHFLRKKGGGPDVLVGICADRSLEMVIGLLAILKAGGAYVPLDPAHPEERLAFMLDGSATRVVLAQERLASLVPRQGVDTICLDAEWPALANGADENPISLTCSEHPAYVIFTSGSTGKPKGVMIPHGGILNRLVWMQEQYGLTADDKVLQKTPFGFDVSVWEFFWPLMFGARLVVARPGGHQDPTYLARVISDEGITTAHFVPSMLQAFLQDTGVRSCGQLKRVICSGEALSADLKERFFARSDAGLLNLYGPTEASVEVTYWECKRQGNEAVVPIGWPIANIQMHVLDERMQPTPVGIPGELYIAGIGLARGYVNRPDLSAERFLADPFSVRPGERMYRTGDLARYRSDGAIEYLGRIDYQVKIRGLRIELGEIEAVLRQCPGIAECVVLAREDSPNDKRIVAYLIVDQPAPSVPELRAFLATKLPDYMTPSFFVTLERLPVSPNGKLDRRALPAPETVHTDGKYVPPRTLVENMLSAIWADVLNLERVSISDDFFELGGHSLLATKLISRVNAALNVNVPLQALFESPTVARLAERVKLAFDSGQEMTTPAVLPVPRDQALPLSFAQENLWLFEQLNPGTPTYTTCRSGRIWGPLNEVAVEAVFNSILSRHESLRTSFRSVNGTPVQIVNPHSQYVMPIVDLGGLDERDREAMAFRLSNEDAQRPIDLAVAPVARVELLQLGPEEHVFVLGIHHVAYDLWSGGLLLEEIEQIYLALTKGEPLMLPPLSVQYADYAVWQRQWLQGEVLERQLSYWKGRLEGLSAAPMEIPTDRPRPLIESMQGSSEYTIYSKHLAEGMNAMARREGVTEFMASLAIFQLLLHRYTGQDDIVVGSVIANRNRVELEGVVGFFDNTIVLRVDASGNPPFPEFLSRVREAALGAYANQHLPFEVLVQELQPERRSSRTPLIQAMFVYLLNYPAMEREVAGLKVVPYNLNSGRAMFDLIFGIHETHRGIEGELNYNCDLFDSGTITRISGHYERLLDAVIANPRQRVDEIAMLSESERTQVLIEWNKTQRDYRVDRCLQQMFELQVERTPASIAVAFEEEGITYAELNRRANQIAHYLRKLGVGPEVRVAVCLYRSIDMLAGILGILKAGGAYVPLDPSYPPERMAYMVQDVAAPILLTQERVKEERGQVIATETSAQTVYLDANWDQIGQESMSNPAPIAAVDDLAYVIYTSGSTGLPKGVAITHRNAVSFLQWAHEAFPDNRLDGVLASTSVCFDLSIFELFLPLCFGGRVILADNVLALPKMAQRTEVTLINTVPSAIRELLNGDGLPDSIKVVNLAGEPLTTELSQQIYATCPVDDLYNLYGPSETTTYSTFARIAAAKGRPPTIGQPIANTQCYVLDQECNLVPPAVPGELYIGGAGIARGYLNRPESTAERFVPDSLGLSPGARMYRTGDRLRWLADGNLEFLGRIDQQVKLRGFRIEPGEIEAVLSSHPSVREAVVIVREDPAQGRRLVAYVVAKGEPSMSTPELRSHLQSKLPEYMVPSAFVMLEELPRTPSGKLNRRALPAPGAVWAERGESYLAPRDDVEFQLIRIWEKLLDVKGIGIRDSFFDLGGYSLLGLRLMTYIQEQFGRHLLLGTLLENPTVERLASLLRQEVIDLERSALVPINPGGSALPFFCVHPIGGNVLCYMELARQLGPERPFYGFQLPESAKDGELDTIEAMASHYLDHLREVQPDGPYRLGGWSMGGVVAFEMAQLLVGQGQRVELLALIDSFVPQSNSGVRNLDDRVFLESFIDDLEGLSGKSIGLFVEGLQRVTIDDVLRQLLDRLRALDIVPVGFRLPELQRMFKLYSTNLRALLTYEPRAYPAKAVLFRAEESTQEQNGDATLGWSKFILDGVEVHEIEADHYSLMAGSGVRLLAERLAEKLHQGIPSAASSSA